MRWTALIAFILGVCVAKAQTTHPDQIFSKWETQSFDTDYFTSLSRSSGKVYMTLGKWNLELEVSNIVSEDYISINQDGVRIGDASDLPTPMNGTTDKGGRVSLTFGTDFIYGFIQEGDELFYIEPARYYTPTKNKEDFIIYNTKDILPKPAGTCGFIELNEKVAEKHQNAPNRFAGGCFEIDYVICNDWSIVSKYGGAAGANAHALAVTNDVNTNYETQFADEYRYVIKGNYNVTCSGCDPSQWTSTTNSTTFLYNFRDWGQATLQSQFEYDVASLWTNRDFDGTTIGVAFVGAICGTYRYNVLEDFSSNADQLRVLVAHELGHNCGSSHDGSGSPYIMAPSVPSASASANITQWSSQSISAINSHLGSRTCLATCTPLTPQVSFVNSAIQTLESGASGSGGSCGSPYNTLSTMIEISKVPSGNVVANVSVSGSSSATSGYDYQIMNSSVTFTPTSDLQLPITIRIYDDLTEENIENLILNLSVSSGDAEVGEITSQTISIESDDAFNPECCVPTEVGFYGESSTYYQAGAIFDGSGSDGKSRMILTAANLQALGITAGYIDMLSLYVSEKTSTANFQDFRIGLREVSESNIQSSSWYSTTQVFIDDVQTIEGDWNNFVFDTPFLWNGTSNLYIEFCFNNTQAIGADKVIFSSQGTVNQARAQFNVYNGTNGCSVTPSGGTAYTVSGIDVSPIALVRQSEVVTVEEAFSATAGTRIRAGEIANLISDNGKIIATIRNTGSTNISCISATVATQGTGTKTLPFGSGEYSDKTIFIDADNNGSYDLTLFYSDAETAVWGGEVNNLQIIKSTSALSSASSSGSTFTTPTTIETDAGAPNSLAYKGSFSGSGYFALTNGSAGPVVTANVAGTFQDADVIINEYGSGLLLKSFEGNQYLLDVNSSGGIRTAMNNSMAPNSNLPVGDLCILTPGKSLLIRRSASSFTQINVDNDGNIQTSNTNSAPTQAVTVETGHFGLLDVASGVIFQNSQNECYKLYIDANGNVNTAPVSCP